MSQQYEHGITTSVADVWVHLCPYKEGGVGVFLYWRKVMLLKLRQGSYQTRKIKTATGYLVPSDEIFVRSVWLPPFEWNEPPIGESDNEVGKWAENCFQTAAMLGFLPPLRWPRRVNEIDRQFQGVDFENVTVPASYETKFDGRVERTGNLFVQTHELHHDPTKRHGHLAVVK